MPKPKASNEVAEMSKDIKPIDYKALLEKLPSRIGYAKAVVEKVKQKHGRELEERQVYVCINRNVYDPDIFWALIEFVEEYLAEMQKQNDAMNRLLSAVDANSQLNGVADDD